MQLRQASRKQAYMKLNLSAPSGGGKTMSALLMAKGLVGEWNKVAVIDTENNSADLYDHLGDYNVIELKPPYTPDRYIQAIDTCLQAGMKCIIIDSSTHEWSGSGGCIDINDRLAAARYKGNTWAAWGETNLKHDLFVNKILQTDCHFITCTRMKMEHVMEGSGQNAKVKKVGMKDMQREGWEYELTVSLNLDRDTHMVTPSKDRTGLFEGKEPFIITEQTGRDILQWCLKGEPLPLKELLTDEHLHWQGIINAMKAGQRTLQQIKDKFTMTEATEQQLLTAIKQ